MGAGGVAQVKPGLDLFQPEQLRDAMKALLLFLFAAEQVSAVLLCPRSKRLPQEQGPAPRLDHGWVGKEPRTRDISLS